ncbi:MAG: type II secretion system F family protein [Hyphomicrobiales bacterium]|nr:type II secretion system F family protein [Hyphomicrobiales bacterium]
MDVVLVLFVSAAFIAVTGAVFAAGHLVLGWRRLRQRLPLAAASAPGSLQTSGGIGALVAEHFNEHRFGFGGELKQKLKLTLIRAGYFNANAIQYYILARLCAIILLPCFAFVFSRLLLPDSSILSVVILVGISTGLGVLGPDAYLSRRQSALREQYRESFPDLLDLLTVCVTAGLTVEAAFDRIRDHMSRRNASLGRNIELMGAEMRAGRSSVDALASLADRLGLDEASTFVAVLRHSLELGGDVAASLRGLSEDMRSRRMLLAEKKANALPVKMVLPLALGVFPVILMIVLLPVILKLWRVIGH